MNEIKDNYTIKTSFWHWKGQADYVDDWFLMGSPYPIGLIILAYLIFVLKIGPAYMKTRPPFKLRNALLLYNSLQVISSVYLVFYGVKILYQYGLFRRYCILDYEDIRKHFLGESYKYLPVKITELLDTVFFVLRKKQNQVSFLHVYHHTFVTVTSWILIKYTRTDDLVFVGTLNSFVHIFMYAYYGLSVFPQLAKHLWWKKYLTTLQLVQFVMVIVYFPIYTAISECPLSYIMGILVFFNTILFIRMFSDFYKNTYAENSKAKSMGTKKDINYEN